MVQIEIRAACHVQSDGLCYLLLLIMLLLTSTHARFFRTTFVKTFSVGFSKL